MAFELVEAGSATPVYKRFCGCTGQHVAPFGKTETPASTVDSSAVLYIVQSSNCRPYQATSITLNAFVGSSDPGKTLFDEQPAFFIDEGRFIPYRMVNYGNESVAYDIGSQLGVWAKPGQGGRVTSSQGAFIFDTDVRMPDVAYTPRETHRGLSTGSMWTYQGEPFVPTFVVEVDKPSGWGSKRSDLDRKMRNEYFQNGVKLGWLVDPRPDCHAMYVYYLDNDNQVQCSANSAWRDLDGGDALPGFRITSTSLDRVLNQDSGSSSEEEVDLTCQLCDQQFTAVGRLTAHLEWHRGERADQKYLAKQKCLGI